MSLNFSLLLNSRNFLSKWFNGLHADFRHSKFSIIFISKWIEIIFMNNKIMLVTFVLLSNIYRVFTKYAENFRMSQSVHGKQIRGLNWNWRWYLTCGSHTRSIKRHRKKLKNKIHQMKSTLIFLSSRSNLNSAMYLESVLMPLFWDTWPHCGLNSRQTTASSYLPLSNELERCVLHAKQRHQHKSTWS